MALVINHWGKGNRWYLFQSVAKMTSSIFVINCLIQDYQVEFWSLVLKSLGCVVVLKRKLNNVKYSLGPRPMCYLLYTEQERVFSIQFSVWLLSSLLTNSPSIREWYVILALGTLCSTINLFYLAFCISGLVDQMWIVNTVMFSQWVLDIQNDNFKYKLRVFLIFCLAHTSIVVLFL